MKGDRTRRGYLFQVDILIEGETNGIALEKLLRILNSDEITDYRIQNGIRLGTVIEASLESQSDEITSVQLPDSPKAAQTSADRSVSSMANPPGNTPHPVDGSLSVDDLRERIERCIQERSLVRLEVNKPRGGRHSIPCRILQFEPNLGNINIYHVDEKKVYLFSMDEIDEIVFHETSSPV